MSANSPEPTNAPRNTREVKVRSIKADSGAGNSDIGVEAAQAQHELWDNARATWQKHDVLEPRFEKDALIRQAQESGAIQECIRAYCDIEGYGYSLVPCLDTEAKSALEQVRWLLWYKAYRVATAAGEVSPEQIAEPSEEEVEVELAKLRRQTRIQKQRAERFFANCGRVGGKPVSFPRLREELRKDIEETGECYVEVLRDTNNQIRRLSHVDSVTIRKSARGEEKVEVDLPERVDDITVSNTQETRTFRKYVQVNINDQAVCYFKEFGDPRSMCKKTGETFADLDKLAAARRKDPKQDPQDLAATELVEWRLRDPLSAYGMPRWVPVAPIARGTRQADETNLDFFDNNGIPALAVLASGGHLGEASIERLREHVKDVKGRGSQHKILVLEAEPYNDMSPPGDAKRQGSPVQLKIEKLSSEQLKDALFLGYVETNEQRIGAIYRVPPLLRGRSNEYTRATAREAIRVFEELVAQTERRRFDDTFNGLLLLSMDISLVKLQTRGPDTSELTELAEALEVMVKAGAITPADLRPLAEKILGRDLAPLDDRWSGTPMALIMAGIVGLAGDEEEGAGNSNQKRTKRQKTEALRTRMKANTLRFFTHDQPQEGALPWLIC